MQKFDESSRMGTYDFVKFAQTHNFFSADDMACLRRLEIDYELSVIDKHAKHDLFQDTLKKYDVNTLSESDGSLKEYFDMLDSEKEKEEAVRDRIYEFLRHVAHPKHLKNYPLDEV